MFKRTSLALLFISHIGCSANSESPQAHPQSGAADLLVVNARIWTADPDRPEASAFLIRDGRFSYVGDDATARAKAPNNTKELNAHGRRILPGLTDSHLHLIDGGLQLSRINLRDVADRAEFVHAVKARAQQMTDGQWMLGGRWTTDSWKHPESPTREWIDPVTPHNPVLLSRMDGHGALANTIALNVAGIDRHGPPDPPGGVIERDPKTGEPTGILKDAAIELVNAVMPKPSDNELDEGLKAAMKHANEHGITAVHTMSEYAHLAAFDRARDRGELTLRIRQYIMEDDWAAYLDRAKAHKDDDWVTVRGFKAYADGSLGSRTALMKEPYNDNPPDKPNWCGLESMDHEARNQWGRDCKEVMLQGYSPAVHAIGDMATAKYLWILTTLNDLLPKCTRDERYELYATLVPRIEHAQHLTPECIESFGKSGVVASMQPLHKADDGRYAEKAIGPERCKTSYAFRSLLDAGALVIFGSDWPVVSLNPFEGVWAAVTGLTLDGKRFVPEQNITVAEALTCYTRNAARAAGDQQSLGMIKEGYHADFVIISPDIFVTRLEDTNKVKVRETYVGGVRVYKRH